MRLLLVQLALVSFLLVVALPQLPPEKEPYGRTVPVIQGKQMPTSLDYPEPSAEEIAATMSTTRVISDCLCWQRKKTQGSLHRDSILSSSTGKHPSQFALKHLGGERRVDGLRYYDPHLITSMCVAQDSDRVSAPPDV